MLSRCLLVLWLRAVAAPSLRPHDRAHECVQLLETSSDRAAEVAATVAMADRAVCLTQPVSSNERHQVRAIDTASANFSPPALATSNCALEQKQSKASIW